jgi:hypothetical protein
MTKNRKYEPDDKEQSARFVEVARSLESDESGKIFDRVVKKIIPRARRQRYRQKSP